MAVWPYARRTTYINDSLPAIDADDLNAMQDRIVDLGLNPIFFGDGHDGAAVLDGAGAVAGCSRSGSVYSLTRDVFWTDATFSAGVTLKTEGFRYYINGVLSGPSSAKITNNGLAATTRIGAFGAPRGTLNGGAKGGDGGTAAGANATDGDNTADSLGGNGGAGGSGDTTAGVAGVASDPTSGDGGFGYLWCWQTGVMIGNNGSGSAVLVVMQGGAGGGGGAGGNDSIANSSDGGGAGGGAGVMRGFIKTVAFDGAFEVVGGAGHAGIPVAGTGYNGGGGGGGGGGDMHLIYAEWSGSATTSAAGGAAGGTSAGGGSAGTAGVDGTVRLIQVSP